MASKGEEGDNRPQQPQWSELLPELLSLICHRLSPIDVARFRAVCKSWNSSGFTIYPADMTPILISETIVDVSGLIRCYSPYLHKMFILHTPLIAPGSKIFSVNANGCALLRGLNDTVVLGNLMDGTTLFETTESEYYGGHFCSPHEDGASPGDPELRGVFGMSIKANLECQSWNGESWECFNGDPGEFRMSHCKPVLHKGLWYCLGESGSVGVYDPVEMNWSVLQEPTGFAPEFSAYRYCYLVESQGELLVVLTGLNGTPIYVLRLNEAEMTWERVESLGNRAIFTGTLTSRTMSEPPAAMANKVYLPKFYGRPQVIQAKLVVSGGRLGFVPEKEERQHRSSSGGAIGGDEDGAWCYDLELDSDEVDKKIVGCKTLMQYIWIDLGRRASP